MLILFTTNRKTTIELLFKHVIMIDNVPITDVNCKSTNLQNVLNWTLA